MKIADIDKFISETEALGYRRGRSFHLKYKPVYSLWKSFHRGEDEWEHKGYQICIGIWDHSLHEGGNITTSFDLKINHQTPIQVDSLSLNMADEAMDVPEFERRCEALWKAMLEIMPRRVESNYSK